MIQILLIILTVYMVTSGIGLLFYAIVDACWNKFGIKNRE